MKSQNFIKSNIYFLKFWLSINHFKKSSKFTQINGKSMGENLFECFYFLKISLRMKDKLFDRSENWINWIDTFEIRRRVVLQSDVPTCYR
jgi:hypothetical protein